jgi:O-antigen ligase
VTTSSLPLRGRPRARHDAATERSDSYLLGRMLVVLLFVTTIDITNYLDTGSQARYAIVLLPFGVVFLARLRHRSSLMRRPTKTDLILLALTGIGLAGSLYGKIKLGTMTTALPAFIPMLIAFSYLFAVEEPSDEEAWRLLKAIAFVGIVYAVLNTLANAQLVGVLRADRNYRNSMSMFVALAFGAVLATKPRRWLYALLILFAVAFVSYPSATFALVGLTTVVTFFMTRPAASPARPYAIGIGILFVLAFALLNFSTTQSLSGAYFQSVGKANDNSARIDLWSAGFHKWEQSPFGGDLFTGETTATVYRQVGYRAPFQAPYHNDYVMFLSSGGLLGLGLLLLWILAVEREALRRYRGYVRCGQWGKANLTRTVLAAFNAWCVAAAFNPLFTGASRSMTLFAFYALLMLLGRPEARPDLGGARPRRQSSSIGAPSGASR